MPKPVTLLLLY